MDTLVEDLLNCIKPKLLISQYISLFYDKTDYPEYHDCLDYLAMFECALKHNNINWIHECLNKLKTTNGQVKNIAAEYVHVYPWLEDVVQCEKEVLLYRARMGDYDVYSEAINTARDDMDKMANIKNIESFGSNSISIITEYCIGQHTDLVDDSRFFEILSLPISDLIDGSLPNVRERLEAYIDTIISQRDILFGHCYDMLLHINDEDYIISKLEKFIGEIHQPGILDKMLLSSLTKKRYKVFKYILSFNPTITDEVIYKLLCTKNISLLADSQVNNITKMTHCVRVACFLSDIEGLEFILEHIVYKNDFYYSITDYCITEQVADYYQHKTGNITPTNKYHFEILDKLGVLSNYECLQYLYHVNGDRDTSMFEIYKFLIRHADSLSSLRFIVSNIPLGSLCRVIEDLRFVYLPSHGISEKLSHDYRYAALLDGSIPKTDIDRVRKICLTLGLNVSDSYTIDQILLEIINNKSLLDLDSVLVCPNRIISMKFKTMIESIPMDQIQALINHDM